MRHISSSSLLASFCMPEGSLQHLHQTVIKHAFDCFLVEFLSYEHQLLLSVAVCVAPISLHVRMFRTKLCKLIGRHCGIPLARILQFHLLACLLKDVA